MLSIVHDINSSFDCDLTIDVRGVFLDISKAFDKFWQVGIVLKLKTYGIKKTLKRIAINGQTSIWELLEYGVAQGFVLGPLMFLICINDLTDHIQSFCR